MRNTYYIYEFDTKGSLVPIEAVEYNASGFTAVYASRLGLVNLEIPDKATHVFCDDNNILELKLPINLLRIRCDKELFNYDECKVREVHICY